MKKFIEWKNNIFFFEQFVLFFVWTIIFINWSKFHLLIFLCVSVIFDDDLKLKLLLRCLFCFFPFLILNCLTFCYLFVCVKFFFLNCNFRKYLLSISHFFVNLWGYNRLLMTRNSMMMYSSHSFGIKKKKWSVFCLYD